MAVGYAAVARNLGRWIAERDIQGTEWVQSHSAFSMLLGGIGALLLPFFAGNVIHMAGDWLGFLESLLTVFGIMATVAAVTATPMKENSGMVSSSPTACPAIWSR